MFSYFTGGVLKEYFGEYFDKGIDELNDLFSNIIDNTVEDSLEFLFDEGTGKLTDILGDITKDKLNELVNKNFYLGKNSIDKLSDLTGQFKENPTPLEIFSKVLQFILYTAIDSKKIIFVNNPHKLDKDSISIISLLLSFGKDLKEKFYHTSISIVYCYSDKNFQPYSNIDKKHEEIKILLDEQRRFAQRYAMLERPSSDIPNIAVKSSTFVGREEELKKLYYRFDISRKDKNFKNIEINISAPNEEKNILELLKNCEMNSTIIVSNLNVFGRTIETILEIVKFLLSNKIRIIVVEQNLDLIDDKDMLTQMILGVISMAIGLEKELMSLRTKEALSAKKLNGMSLGKPKGTIQKSKFDMQREKIEELLAVGLSVRKISKLLGYNNHIGLNNYVKKRKIKINLKND